MATSMVMPQMGYDMKEGKVVRWFKKEGEEVVRGEVIAEIETDKATVEYEAYTGGVMAKIVAQEGVTIPVGGLIAVITSPGEAIPDDIVIEAAPAESAGSPAPVAAEAPAPAAAATPATGGEVRASPMARRLARERGIDLATITGTGPGGRIVESDIPEQGAPTPAPVVPAPDGTAAPAPMTTENVELSRMRQAIAKVTVDSKREAPHFYVTVEVDMTKAMSFRRDINDELDAEQRVSVNDLIVKASAIAIGRHPKFNSFYRDGQLQMNASINVGIAIALESGLIVPGIPACENKSLVEIATANRGLISRANSGALRNEEYSGTTFSVSNLGAFDVDSFTAIIFPPHAAILAVGTVKEQPVVRDGELAVAQIMKATLSTDHRVADGAEAAQFLVEIKKLLENPVSLVI